AVVLDQGERLRRFGFAFLDQRRAAVAVGAGGGGHAHGDGILQQSEVLAGLYVAGSGRDSAEGRDGNHQSEDDFHGPLQLRVLPKTTSRGDPGSGSPGSSFGAT